MKNYRNLLLAFVMLVVVSAACQNQAANNESSNEDVEITQTKKEVTDGVFIHITHSTNDPHRVVMPLKMATMMATDKDVLVYFDINGVEVVNQAGEDIAYKDFPTAKESLQQLIDKGVTVFACPSCMEAEGMTEADLMEGVEVADKATFFNFTEGRIITLDY